MNRLQHLKQRRRLRMLGGVAILLLLPAFLIIGRAIVHTRVDRPDPSDQPVHREHRAGESSLRATPEAPVAVKTSLVRRSDPQTPMPAPPADESDSTIVRVNLTAAPVHRMRLAIDGPFRVLSLQSNDSWDFHEGLSASDAIAADGGIRIGIRNFAGSSMSIVPQASPAVWINGRQYRGEVRLHRRSGNRLIAVNHLPLNDYLASVVDSEMPAAFPSDARRAQAIVARTYALSQRQGHPLFDLFATSRSQRYLGSKFRDERGRLLAGESADSRRIVRETAGIACTYRGSLFCTYYSAVCGGRTTPGEWVFADAAPPLKSVPCSWCRDAKYFRWSRRVGRDRAGDLLRRFFGKRGRALGTIQSIHTLQESAVPFPRRFTVADERDRFSVSAVELRGQVFPETLPSPFFSVADEHDDVVFNGRGHGHGVGLCQWGARGMALSGKNCREILAHYYPGSRLTVFDRQQHSSVDFNPREQHDTALRELNSTQPPPELD